MKEENKSEAAPKISIQEPVLPKGGGAIKGLGDSFEANLYSGAGTYSIPIPITKARGFEPSLSLMYSSGAGNSEFGLGFSLALPKISVSTRFGIPKYDKSNLYLFMGDELVRKKNTAASPNPVSIPYLGKTYLVTTYLERTQSAYSQIEQWQDEESGLSFWKIISADNTTSFFGRSNTSRLFNPDCPTQIFEWLIDESTDAKGNIIAYTYKAENNDNVKPNVYELSRSYSANRYIRSIKYGNYFDDNQQVQFAFEVVFNYGDINLSWSCRNDPFSSYLSGFEIRTYRLCQKIQMLHNFPNEIGDPLVIKEIALQYENIQAYASLQFQSVSLLNKITLTGYKKESDGSIEKQSLPELQLAYSSFLPPPAPQFNTLTMDRTNIPGYLNATQFLPVDLNGDGLPGFLFSNRDSNFYLEPLGNGRYNLPLSNPTFPINKNLQNGNVLITDIDGNGELELLVKSANSQGYYSRSENDGWNNFIPFEKSFNDINNPQIESSDLNGNGKTDLLLADTNNIIVYESEGKAGYNVAKSIINENDFPLVKQNFKQELVTFASVFGDGLAHRIKISSGLVECWPCLGNGRFGKKVTLDNAPVFDDNFDTGRLFITDIDGSGTADIAYVYPDRVELFLNQSGNSFSDPIVIYLPQLYSSGDQISFSDILGNGTTCLVFTKIAPVPVHYYYNFIGEISMPDGTKKPSLKPYLLNKISNNMGTITHIDYCSSTKFSLEDKLAGQPWTTKLAFPVQVVEQITTYDALSKSRYVNKYRYHNGFYDTVERQFRGFGFVESWDTETFEEFKLAVSNPDFPTSALNKELFVPPVYTKTWYLNGAWTSEYEKLLAQYRTQYFKGDLNACSFPDCQFSDDIYSSNLQTIRESFAALAGKEIHSEVYGIDNLPVSVNPYTVNESNYKVVLIQPASENQYAVFRVDSLEDILYYYERNKEDPRIEQHFVLDTDPLCGLVKQSCSVYLSRRNPTPPLPYSEQYVIKGTITTVNYFNTPENNVFRLRGIEYERQEFEVLGINQNAPPYFTFNQINTIVKDALKNIVPYQGIPPASGSAARQIEMVQSFFWDINQVNCLPLGQVSARALIHHIATAEFTNDNIEAMFGKVLTASTINELGGYIYNAITGYWENRGLIQNYYTTAQSFYMPSGAVSSTPDLGMISSVIYDNYFLLPVKTIRVISDSPGIPIINENNFKVNYRVMAPCQLTDWNGNVNQLLFDALGQVIVSSLFGSENGITVGGMRLLEYYGQPAEYILRTTAPDGSPINLKSVLSNEEYYLQGAATYFYYNLNAFTTFNQPLNAVALQRKNYYHEASGSSAFSCQTIVSYSDGLGRVIERKQKAESDDTDEVWLTSGRTVYNNKGEVCEAYLPFFSNTFDYEDQDNITNLNLVPPPTVTHYDPLLRIVRVDTPKGFFSEVEFTPWEQKQFDENDTVLASVYYKNFIANYPSNPTQQQVDEKNALEKAAVFYNTPGISILDNMGHVIRDIQTIIRDIEPLENRSIVTFYEVDIVGRRLTAIDPRLYKSNLISGSSYFNFKYQYTMGNEQPVVIDSADSGLQKYFYNIFENQVWSLSGRNYCQVIFYDWLQRETQLKVKKLTTKGPVTTYDGFNLVEIYVYGEQAVSPQGKNLRGEVYQVNDLSGIIVNSSYSMQGEVLTTERQLVKEYKTAIDWNKPVIMCPEKYKVQFTYNALSQLLTETTPDTSISKNDYNTEGLLCCITLMDEVGNSQNIINDITYNANRQRIEVIYGNGMRTAYSYEDTTLRLIRLISTKYNLPAEKVMQDIDYTYDPAGNITRSHDHSIGPVFNSNQQVKALAGYTYDSIYRLAKANGRQHPGINANTYKNNLPGSFMQSIFSQLPVNNTQALENYNEIYTYDDSGNLINKQHTGSTPVSTWSVATPVLDSSNRLTGFTYDASGNQRQLSINNTVSLAYNCCENLVSAMIIERPEEEDDADYYQYDSAEMRTRKTSIRFANGGANNNYIEKVYLGNYEIKRTGTENSSGTRTIDTERQALRVMDGTTCVAVTYNWVIGGSSPSKQIRFQFGNKLGSVSMEMDASANLISYEEYFPYGGTSIIAGTNQLEVSQKEYRFSGKECDNSTGLYYYGRRYYASWLGRWLNPDPAGTVDGLNLFAFVSGNPISFEDLNGMMKRTHATAFSQGTDSSAEIFIPAGREVMAQTGMEELIGGREPSAGQIRLRAQAFPQITTMGQSTHEVLPTSERRKIARVKNSRMRSELAQAQSGLRSTPALIVMKDAQGRLAGHTGTFVNPSAPKVSQATKYQKSGHDVARDAITDTIAKGQPEDVLMDMTMAMLDSMATGPEIRAAANLFGLTPNLLAAADVDQLAATVHEGREEVKDRGRAYRRSLPSQSRKRTREPSPPRDPMTAKGGGQYSKRQRKLPPVPTVPAQYPTAHMAAWISQSTRLK